MRSCHFETLSKIEVLWEMAKGLPKLNSGPPKPLLWGEDGTGIAISQPYSKWAQTTECCPRRTPTLLTRDTTCKNHSTGETSQRLVTLKTFAH